MDLGGKSEIKDFDVTGSTDHDVSGFDVAMYDFLTVGIIQSVGDLLDHGKHFFKFESAFLAFLFDPLPQVFSFATLHDEVIVAVGVIPFQVVAAGDIGVVQVVDKLEVFLDVVHFKGIM